MRIVLVIICLSILVLGCKPEASEAHLDQPKTREATAAPSLNIQAKLDSSAPFTDRLMQSLAKSRPNQNFMVSPWSISNCLEMVRLGAGGETEKELRTFLAEKRSPAEAGAIYETVRAKLKPLQDQGILVGGNELWIRNNPSCKLKEEYVSQTKRFYDATVTASNFPDPALHEINQYVSDKTRGKIKSIIERLSSDDFAVLVNAICFKDKWVTPFLRNETKTDNFYTGSGHSVQVPMMNQDGEFLYMEAKGFQAVQLPYKSNLRMTIVLPKRGQKLMDALDFTSLSSKPFEDRQGHVSIPKWTADFKLASSSLWKLTAAERCLL